MNQTFIRNVAVIAHVDHGKTTLVDAFIKQSNLFRNNQKEMQTDQLLDSGDLERERGITITAKNISIRYKDYKINIIDTPGHADFGGEVERTLNMADGCLLLVDAQEGPMPQTKFVLKKALELKLKPIVIINKIDKPYANVSEVTNQLQDLFLSLATDDSQLDFTILYAIGREGKVFDKLPDGDLKIPNSIPGNIEPLLKAIVDLVPYPKGDINGDFQMQITSLDFDPHLGRYLIGRIKRGKIKNSDNIVIIDENKTILCEGKIKKLEISEGLTRQEVEQASVGEIIAIAGLDSYAIGATVCERSKLEPLPMIKLTPPSVKITFEANTSPLLGKEGKFVTIKQLQQRLEKEKEINIGLQIDKKSDSSYTVSGRGELQLAILIETMRRESYEFQVKKPEVIFKKENGKTLEPLEELTIDTTQDFVGTVTEMLNKRNAQLIDLQTRNGEARFIFHILTRNLLGLRNILITQTRGNLNMNNFLIEFVPVTHQQELDKRGVLVSFSNGITTGYALSMAEVHGNLFISAGTEVYEGMIIGINKYPEDIAINVNKERAKNNVRKNGAALSDTNLKTPMKLTLEYALSFIADDEMLEVTPLHFRLRKIFLTQTQRDVAKRKERKN